MDDLKLDKLEQRIREQQTIIYSLYGVIVHSMVVMKYLARFLAVGACWFWLGHKETYFLIAFIMLLGLMQLIIDKTRKVANPELKLSEWDLT